MYKLIVEQAYINYGDLLHFMEEGPFLKELTTSDAMIKSLQLLINC